MPSIKIQNNMTLLEAIALLFPDSSKTKLRTWIKVGRVSVDGAVFSHPNAEIMQGQTVELLEEKKRLGGGVELIYDDKDFVVVNKPSGLLSVATETETIKTVHNILKRYYHGKQVYVIHRLDKEASGVMLFALNEKAFHKLKEIFAKHDLQRIYLAIVEGRFQEDEGTWISYLREDEGYKMHSSQNPSSGDKSITHFQLIQTGKDYSALQLTLETGKKNQIRVHCQVAGHSIAGDKKYGAKTSPLKRVCLHSHYLAIAHPRTGKAMQFESPVPPAFMKLVKKR